MENESLELLEPVPDERLMLWLCEFYGKQVKVARRETLRHRDLSKVERLWITDSLPETIIYKQVLPPWDIERDLLQDVLVPSIANSALLYMSAHIGQLTVMFMEDLGGRCLLNEGTEKWAAILGKEMAKLHRAYSYRIDEMTSLGILPMLTPVDYENFAEQICDQLGKWNLIDTKSQQVVCDLMSVAATQMAGEPISLVHGDLYAENLIVRGSKIYMIDWSWFAMIGVPLIDLATVTMNHFKNGNFAKWGNTVIDAYCFESGRPTQDVKGVIPVAEAFSQVLLLHWLVERRRRGIMGTTVGPVDNLIAKIITEIKQRHAKLS